MLKPRFKSLRNKLPRPTGFGKSDKYTSMDMYTHDLHTLTLKLFIQHLKYAGYVNI